VRMCMHETSTGQWSDCMVHMLVMWNMQDAARTVLQELLSWRAW